MEKNKQLVPERRFKEFENDGEWNRYKLEDLVHVNSGRDYKHLSSGTIPVYGTGGYMVSVDEALSYSTDAIGIGRKGTIDKPYLLEAPFWTVDTLFYAISQENNHLYFMLNIFKNINWKVQQETSGVPSLTRAAINNVEVFVPKDEEQEEIGLFIKKLDQLIRQQRKKIEKSKKIKESYLSDMFPKEGEKYPKKRFEGFIEPWKKARLGELSDISTGKLDANAMVTNGRYDFYTSGIKKYKIDIPAFEGPAITIAGNGATVGYMHLADGKFNAYQRTYVLQNFKAIREFVYLEVENKLPQKINQEARMGNIPYIVMDMLTDLEIVLPQIEEQTKIASFFRNLDNQIALEEKKLEKLEQLKQAYLNELFV